MFAQRADDVGAGGAGVGGSAATGNVNGGENTGSVGGNGNGGAGVYNGRHLLTRGVRQVRIAQRHSQCNCAPGNFGPNSTARVARSSLVGEASCLTQLRTRSST